MKLGAFSVSLAGNHLGASQAFYRKFGFEVFHGDADQGWLILKNGASSGLLCRVCSVKSSATDGW